MKLSSLFVGVVSAAAIAWVAHENTRPITAREGIARGDLALGFNFQVSEGGKTYTVQKYFRKHPEGISVQDSNDFSKTYIGPCNGERLSSEFSRTRGILESAYIEHKKHNVLVFDREYYDKKTEWAMYQSALVVCGFHDPANVRYSKNLPNFAQDISFIPYRVRNNNSTGWSWDNLFKGF